MCENFIAISTHSTGSHDTDSSFTPVFIRTESRLFTVHKHSQHITRNRYSSRWERKCRHPVREEAVV